MDFEETIAVYWENKRIVRHTLWEQHRLFAVSEGDTVQ